MAKDLPAKSLRSEIALVGFGFEFEEGEVVGSVDGGDGDGGDFGDLAEVQLELAALFGQLDADALDEGESQGLGEAVEVGFGGGHGRAF